MKRFFLVCFGFLCLAFLIISCQTQERTDTQETSSEVQVRPSPLEQDCSFCGMPSGEFPKFNAYFKTASSQHGFCSTRCLFAFYLNDENQITAADITEAQVTDYYTTKKIEAKKAFYVSGSQQKGPMGADFMPFDTQDAAQEFKIDHKGEAIYTFEQINASVLSEVLQGKK
ncbi:MAG: nitrous oxide reductase accessory protein NosL [Bernardetiaceae bacterium]|nr:nitrous oxide reductase accessory protein NosL [Bernardetiaceae bacterium]